MSDLQVLLISIGAALIVIVLLYNGWQEWRARRSMRATVPETDHDILLQDAPSRREPGLFDAEPASAAADDLSDIDATCEAVIDIAFAHPVAGDSLTQVAPSITRAGKKPVRVFAQREGGGHRMVIHPDESYVALQLAVVVANRSGPLTAIEWSNLWTLAQNVAERFDGQIEAPEQEAVLRQAVDLDARCAPMDAQVGLILQLSAPQSPQAVADAAAEAGFVPSRGLWAWMAENGLPRFVLQIEQPASDAGIHRIDLVLDVPNSIPDDQAFSRMVAVGRDLAQRLDAHVLDDQGRTFQDASAPPIDQQISSLYDQLDQAGFLAGTERTARVFS
ncbi:MULTISPECIES: cell division protein ZipA C-terminal FtsZ-binding domain-containing protein [unclassified Castellaniella]|uniref:cell division protein ZipA C-terminal FtsZ-binding domain-containing protein n=1 Tax=unclassified Castellaniella TaxID=2617606 RepID=UPI003314810E